MALDGRFTPLTEIRKEARDNHMSPTTLTDSLRKLQDLQLVKRVVDDKAQPPRVYYKRTNPLPKGVVDFDSWMEHNMKLIQTSVRSTLEKIAERPGMSADEMNKIREHMRNLVETVCDSTVGEFRELLRLHRIAMPNPEGLGEVKLS